MMEQPSEKMSARDGYFTLPKNDYFTKEVERSNGKQNQDYFNVFDALYSYI